jgi:hypothetical protein
MNITTVKVLFQLFSGFDESETANYLPVIEMAVSEVGRMLKNDAAVTDARLDFLAAALANYRCRQFLCAQDRTEVTYEGKMSRDEHSKAIEFAYKLLRDYQHLCDDLIVSTDFMFMAVASGEGESNA